ncbi:MAG: CcmD family protein [Gemmatimonadota bacterium]
MPRALILILSIVVFSMGEVEAQQPPAATGAAQVEPGTPQAMGVALQAAPAQTGSPLPQQNATARTMRAYWHVFIAFAVVWLLLFGYALTVGRRFGQLEEEVRRLRSTS